MKRSTFTATQEQFDAIDALVSKYGFTTRSAYLRVAALHYGNGGGEEDTVQQLTQAVYWLHKIQNAQGRDLHLLKSSDVASMMKQLSSALATITRVG